MFDAVVLAGGAATRLNGADKPSVEIAGSSLLARVVIAVSDARHIVVVGPERPVSRKVLWCLEDPVGGGPVAAIAAGVRHIEAPVVVITAADLPWIKPAIRRLVEQLGQAAADAAVLVDADGRRNYVAAAWRRAALVTALRGVDNVRGAPTRSLYRDVDVVDVVDHDGDGADCDTWADIDLARQRALFTEDP